MLRRWIGNAALAVASLFVFAVLLELLAWVSIEWDARKARAAASDPISAYHPQLGWFHVPGARRRIVRPEFDIGLRFNRHGLRGPERAYEPPPGVARTLLLGDSFAEGYYAEEDQTAAAVLERRLQSCGRQEVINAGVQGYSTDQEYLLYVQEGRRYRARVVLLFFHSNDLPYNVSPVGSGGEAKPYFDLDAEDRLVRRNDPVPPPPPDRASRARPGVHRPTRWRGSLALRLLSNRTADSSPTLHGALARLGLVEPLSRDAPMELWSYGPEHVRAVEEMWRRTRALLVALRDAVAADGARLGLLYVPARFEVDDAVWELTRARYAMGRRWATDRVFLRLEGICRELGIPLADPRAALRQAEASGRPAYYTRDTHWNARGNEIAARAVEPLARGMLGCGR